MTFHEHTNSTKKGEEKTQDNKMATTTYQRITELGDKIRD